MQTRNFSGTERRPLTSPPTKTLDAESSAALNRLAEQIRQWRKRQSMTQSELAVRSGISVSFISMIERGERSPSYETLVQMAGALEIPLSELFRVDEGDAADDGYFRRLVEFARRARLSRKQVERLIAVGEAMFVAEKGERTEEDSARSVPAERRCAVPGCGRPLLARGLCPSHYRRRLREER